MHITTYGIVDSRESYSVAGSSSISGLAKIEDGTHLSENHHKKMDGTNSCLALAFTYVITNTPHREGKENNGRRPS